MILPLDMVDTEQIHDGVLKVLQRWGRIDVLINNAGVCYRAVTEQMDMESEEIQLRTNYLGPMALIRSVVSVMRENGRGKIINISSVSGVMGMPTMGSYSASKHALEGASESLWYELKPFGINVSVVRPGFINNEGHTHVASASKAKIAEKLSGPYADFYIFMRPFVSALMRISPQTSNTIADKIIKVIKTQNPPLWVNATLDAHLFSLLRWILPESWFHKLINVFFLRAAKWGQGYSRADRKRLSA
jgi:short-subunit dehydrogenase